MDMQPGTPLACGSGHIGVWRPCHPMPALTRLHGILSQIW
jgi:hypothetical protein